MLTFVFPTVSELRFYGCCHPCSNIKRFILLQSAEVYAAHHKLYSFYTTQTFHLSYLLAQLYYTMVNSYGLYLAFVSYSSVKLLYFSNLIHICIVDKALVVLLWRHTFWERERRTTFPPSPFKRLSSLLLSRILCRHNRILWAFSRCISLTCLCVFSHMIWFTTKTERVFCFSDLAVRLS